MKSLFAMTKQIITGKNVSLAWNNNKYRYDCEATKKSNQLYNMSEKMMRQDQL